MILLHPNVHFYCFEYHSVTKIKYGHPWPNKVIKRSQNTFHKVTYGFNVQRVRIFGREPGLIHAELGDYGTTKVIQSMLNRVHI